MKRYRLVLAALLVGTAAMPGASAGDVPLPAEAITGGIDQAGLTATWWQWALSLPLEPYMDPDGSQCRLGQEGPVWFLAGTDGSFDAERRCQVPLGTYLFLPVASRFAQTPLDAKKDQDVPGCEALRATIDMPPAGLLRASVRIDGVDAPDVAGHRIRSADCFDPYPGIPVMEGRHAPLAASDGYWILVPPLPPGRHVLEVDAHYRSDDGFETLQRFKYELLMGALPQYVMR